jgi:DNA polymerase-3 subunit epsilon
MKGYRALELGGSASLSAVCHRIRRARAGDLHGAVEDAWLAMKIYLWLHRCPIRGQSRRSLPRIPYNFRRAETGPHVDRQAAQFGMSVKRGKRVRLAAAHD